MNDLTGISVQLATKSWSFLSSRIMADSSHNIKLQHVEKEFFERELILEP